MDESWDDITFDDLADQPETDEPEAEETEVESEAEEAEQQPEAEEQPSEEAPADQFELKHLDEVRSVGREEVIALAQKGMDYDRVRQKYDAAKPAVEWYEKNSDTVKWLEEMAAEQNMSLAEMVDETRAEIMARKTNQSVAVCRGIVANERKALELEARQKAMEATDKNSKVDEEVQEFLKAYPDVGPDSIPQDVWDDVNKGETLINAYRAYENKQLKEQLKQEKAAAERRAQEEKNKARSTGSQSTAGKKDMDAFDSLWYDGN